MRNWFYQVFMMELRKLLAYRADFWINFIGQTFFSLLIAYYLWESIFTSTGKAEINGFSIETMIFYYLLAPLIFRIQQGQGIGFISREIYDGSLNKYLLYPMNFFKYKLATYGANSFFYILQLLFIIFLYTLFFNTAHVYEFKILPLFFFLLSLIIGIFCFYFMFCLVEFMAFWFDNTWSLGVILRFATSFLGGALIPLSFFPSWSQTFISYTPFPYLIDLPMNILMLKIESQEMIFQMIISVVWTVFFATLALLLWRKGNLQYSGVGI